MILLQRLVSMTFFWSRKKDSMAASSPDGLNRSTG
jgi:hypothetical protein